jgi:hypothetical protein
MYPLKSLWRPCVAAVLLMVGSGGPGSAFAGAGEISAQVTAVSPQVTYATTSPPLNTYFVLQGSLANTGGNTINNITFTVTVSATDTAEQIQLFSPTTLLPPGCSQTGPGQFTCTILQLKSGASFTPSPFTIFYKAPVQVINGTADNAGSDFARADVHVVYAEGTNGVPNSQPQNSIADFGFPSLVLFGTNTPSNVKSAVPQSGSILFTSTDGIPTTGNKSTEKAAIPSFTAPYALSDITITDNTADPQCTNLGNFFQCSFYSTTIKDAQQNEVPFPTSPWLTTTYRIDASNLKLTPSKVLNNVQLYYIPDGSPIGFTGIPVLACVNSAVNTGGPGDAHPAGVPCVLSAQCFKKGTSGSQNGYCEWNLINIRNGTLKIL